MSEKSNNKAGADLNKQMASNVTALRPEKCISEDCKRSPDRAGFCEEHYVWFKEGLITASGKRAKDFDKQYHAWMRRTAKSA